VGFTPTSRLRLKAGQSGKSGSFTPFADDLTGRIQPGSDDIVGETFIGEKDDLGPDHIAIRRRIFSGHGFQR
jgi:hypothetical protein